MRRRILMIGINYAPELVGNACYTTGVAEHFAAEGHFVRVVTGIPHNPTWRRMRYSRNGSRNPRVSHYQHYIPARPSAARRMVYEASWLVSASRGLLTRPCDIAIGVVPSLSGGVLAWMAGRRFRVPFGLIFQDLPGAAALQSGYQGAQRLAGITSWLEGLIVRRAQQIVVISDGFRPYLEGLGVASARIKAVTNWVHLTTPTESMARTRARFGWAPTDFVCLHTGNMGQKQGLSNLIEAAKRLEGQRIKFVLVGDGNDKPQLVAKTKELGLTNVSFVPLQPDGLYESMLRAADILLLNQRGSVKDMALPGKLTSYFASGRPVVAAIAPDSDSDREIQKSMAGIRVPPDDPAALAKAVLSLRHDPATGDRLGLAGLEYARRSLGESQALAAYDAFLDRLANSC